MGWTNKNKRLSFKMPLYTRIKCDIIPFAFTANINSFLFGIFHIFSVIIHHIGFLADKVHVSPLHIVMSGIDLSSNQNPSTKDRVTASNEESWRLSTFFRHGRETSM